MNINKLRNTIEEAGIIPAHTVEKGYKGIAYIYEKDKQMITFYNHRYKLALGQSGCLLHLVVDDVEACSIERVYNKVFLVLCFHKGRAYSLITYDIERMDFMLHTKI